MFNSKFFYRQDGINIYAKQQRQYTRPYVHSYIDTQMGFRCRDLVAILRKIPAAPAALHSEFDPQQSGSLVLILTGPAVFDEKKKDDIGASFAENIIQKRYEVPCPDLPPSPRF